MRILFEMEKETKNTVRFQEVVGSKFDPTEIGTLYVQKNCLRKIGYREGQLLEVNITVNEEAK